MATETKWAHNLQPMRDGFMLTSQRVETTTEDVVTPAGPSTLTASKVVAEIRYPAVLTPAEIDAIIADPDKADEFLARALAEVDAAAVAEAARRDRIVKFAEAMQAAAARPPWTPPVVIEPVPEEPVEPEPEPPVEPPP